MVLSHVSIRTPVKGVMAKLAELPALGKSHVSIRTPVKGVIP